MYPGKRRQRNFKRIRTFHNSEFSTKCPRDIGPFGDLLHGHTNQQQSSANVLPSNPSKRHRERLNGELETVASLLPYEVSVLQRLDKLSVLRLAVAFLQIKAHFQVCAQKASSTCDGCCAEHPLARLHGSPVERVPTLVNPQNGMATLDYGEMRFTKLAQKALGAFLLALHLDGDIFYVSENIETYLGFQQSDLLHQSLFELIHSEDRDELRTLLQNAMQFALGRERRREGGPFDGTNSRMSFADWSFSVVLRFRCLLDYSCGFNRAEFRCRLISVHSHRVELSPFVPPSAQRMRNATTAQQTQQREQNATEFGTENWAKCRKYALVATCTPFAPPPQLDPQLDDPILRSRHSLDFGFQNLDLRFRCILEMDESPAASFSSVSDPTKQTLYSFVHPDDLKNVAEAHETAIKYTSSNLLVYRLISKHTHLINYFQSAFKMFAKNGKPDRIEANHRMLTEIDGELLLEKRNSPKFKNFSFDDTLLLSPRNLHNQQQQIVAVGQQRSSLQQNDFIDTTDTEIIPTAAFSPNAHPKAIVATAKSKKGKKTGRREAHEREGKGTDGETIGTGTNVASSAPSASALFPSSATVRLPASQFELFSSSSSSFLPHHHIPNELPPLPPATLPSSAEINNDCHLSSSSSSLSWPNAAQTLAPLSHGNGTPRLKRTQFTFERYYAETVDVSPYACYYYCPPSSSTSAGGVFPHNASPIVDFSSGIYPPSMATTDYWNSMLAMAANPTAGGGEDTDCFGGTAQQQQLVPLPPSPLISAVDPSAHFSLQFQQQFSPAWLNAAGSVFNFAAAASQFWPSSQQICANDFDHSLAMAYENGGQNETLAVADGGTAMDEMAKIGEMAMAQRRMQNEEGQRHGDGQRDDRQMANCGQRDEGSAKRPHGGAASAEGEIAKNVGPPLPLIPAQQSTHGNGGFLHTPTNATTMSNASGFRFLTEMAQTLFG
ncbi:hypothetical protein niasHS_006774 [Heterodera schachtii]|uniref:Aryl hydrocarbon receptor n=1 Tax=Heterodera schachtii TaxID=97005 RepID=A0ABD2JIG5_HETSC